LCDYNRDNNNVHFEVIIIIIHHIYVYIYIDSGSKSQSLASETDGHHSKATVKADTVEIVKFENTVFPGGMYIVSNVYL